MNYEAPKITVDNPVDIHAYVCFLLLELGDLTEEQLSDIITECEAVNYYEYLESLSMITEKELVSVTADEKKGTIYHLLANGIVMAQQFYKRIPLSVREKSLEYGRKVLETAELERSVKCRIERLRDGKCYLTVQFMNEMGGPDLMNIKIFAPDLEQAKKMRERFLEKPSDIVAKIMNMFIKDSFL